MQRQKKQGEKAFLGRSLRRTPRRPASCSGRVGRRAAEISAALKARAACSSGDIPPLRPFSEARRNHHIRQDSCLFGHARTFGFCADGKHRNLLRGEAEQGSISELGVLETPRRTRRNCFLTLNHYHLCCLAAPPFSCLVSYFSPTSSRRLQLQATSAIVRIRLSSEGIA